MGHDGREGKERGTGGREKGRDMVLPSLKFSIPIPCYKPSIKSPNVTYGYFITILTYDVGLYCHTRTVMRECCNGDDAT